MRESCQCFSTGDMLRPSVIPWRVGTDVCWWGNNHSRRILHPYRDIYSNLFLWPRYQCTWSCRLVAVGLLLVDDGPLLNQRNGSKLYFRYLRRVAVHRISTLLTARHGSDSDDHSCSSPTYSLAASPLPYGVLHVSSVSRVSTTIIRP